MACQNIVDILERMRENTKRISADVNAKALERQKIATAREPLPAPLIIRGSGTAYKQSMGASRRIGV